MMSVEAALFVMLAGVAAEDVQQSVPSRPVAATIETLAREGYEIKAIHGATARGGGFVVMMQRSGEVRSCLMRIERNADGRPSRRSVCF